MRYITVATDNPGPDDIGWKAHRQWTMERAGLPVPRFFCIPRRAFDAWLHPVSEELAERVAALDLRDRARFAGAVASIQEWLSGQPLPDEVSLELRAALCRTFAPSDRLAVRGCFVGVDGSQEDSREHPFAGASLSLLHQEAAEVGRCVVACFASVVSLPALVYRHSNELGLMSHGVAVMVQMMAPAEKSFVAFTRDPRSGERVLVVAAAHGVGEGVVQERADTDHFFLDPEGRILRSEVVRKSKCIVVNESGNGVVEGDVPPTLADAPVLGTSELEPLARLATTVERLFGEPQDIEGGFADGEVFLVQSRPISQADPCDRVIWDNANVTESFPGVTRPLTYSFARLFYAEVFTDCFRRLGLPENELERLAPEFDRMVGYLDGRIYYRLSTFYRIFSAHPLFVIYREPWEKAIGLDRPPTEPTGSHPALAMMRGTFNLLRNLVSLEADMRRFYLEAAKDLDEVRAAGTECHTAGELVDRARVFSRRSFRYWGATLVNDIFLILSFGILERLANQWGICDDASLINDLLCGENDIVSAQVVESAVLLGEVVQAQPALMQLYERCGPEGILAELARTGRHPTFVSRVSEHLVRYGARGPQDLKLETPSPREAPEGLMRIVFTYARDGVRLADITARERMVREQAEATLARRLAGHPLRRWVIGSLLGIVRRTMAHRERSRYARSELFQACRGLYAATGDHLARAGVLERSDDVFDLSLEEVEGAVSGTAVTGEFQALVNLRRDERARAASTRAASRVESRGIVAARRWDHGPEASNAGELVGLGSSAGIARGPARVLLHPDEPFLGEEAPILVARETDPGWLYVMLASRGLVVERGSLLSHTAIAGRKLGIPTVVGVRGATARIRNGETLQIDGTAGTVRRIDDEEQAA